MTVHTGSAEQTTPYDFLNPFGLHTDFKALVQEGNLELLLRRRDGVQVLTDIITLTQQDEQEIERLKTRLVGRIQSYSGDQSYQGAVLNQHGGVFNSALNYIDLIAEKAKVDSVTIEELKVAVIKAAINRNGRYRAFVHEGVKHLFERAEREIMREKYEEGHAAVVH